MIRRATALTIAILAAALVALLAAIWHALRRATGAAYRGWP